jgi:hypothetical protein
VLSGSPSKSLANAVLHTDRYSDKLDELVYDGLRLFNLDVRGKSVLLKPNILEYIRGKPVNTDQSIHVDSYPHGADDKAIEKFRLVDAIADTVGDEVAAKLIAKVTQQDFLMDHGRLA